MCVRWPVREGMKTIRQIADEIGVSKQAVYKRYKGKLYTVCAPYAHTEQGVLYLSEQAETLIKQDFLRDGCPNGSHTDTHTERSIGAVPEQSQEAGVVAILQATIDTLQGQLSVKDKEENQRLQQKIPSTKEKLKEAQERQRLENQNRKLLVQVECLEQELEQERSFSDRLLDGVSAVMDFLDRHLPEKFRPLVERARELLPVPEVQQPEQEQERGHTWGGMEL